MRPVRIRVEGFSAYRRPTEVDLDGVDFFSLSGPTGSGKSSLIDAMIFALYGRVPRLGGNTVAPVISAGADRARVAFEFEVNGDRYTAARLVQRSSRGGASVSEARLEKGDVVLANGADDLTATVEELLHLTFEDFVRTVVLPQGQFARFLTATKAERQSLLRNLLGLDVYSEVRSRAKEREAAANARAAMARAQIESIELPSEEEMAEAAHRLEILEALAGSVGSWEMELVGLEERLSLAQAERDAHKFNLAALQQLEAPPHLEELDGLAASARDLVEALDAELEPIAAERAALESELALLPQESAVRLHLDLWSKREALNRRLALMDIEGAAKSADEADSAVATARRVLEEAETRLESLKASHAAHQLAAGLSAGEPCPVCERPLDETPDPEAPVDLEDHQRARSEASELLQVRLTAQQKAKTDQAEIDASVREVRSQLAEVEAGLERVPPIDELEAILGERSRIATALEDSTNSEGSIQARRKKAATELEGLSESIRTVQRDLIEARERVVALAPPLPESEDPIVQWKELLSWRDNKQDEVAGAVTEAVGAVTAAGDALSSRRSEIGAQLQRAGIDETGSYEVAVTRHLSKAQTLIGSYKKAETEVAKLEASVSTAESEAAVANALAGHLTAAGFERWLMAGAIADLVAGANDLLRQLSEDGYSLSSDSQGSFSIVDHRNANEARSVATLSGGETFLVSLALALSLAETLASAGGADLDAIILDEGFGTLDDESLEIVAAVLEELSGGGPMVGVITHVKELAARAPVRFEVSKTPAGASVKVAS